MDDYLCLVCLIKAGGSTAVSWQTEINSYGRRLATRQTSRRFVIDCRFEDAEGHHSPLIMRSGRASSSSTVGWFSSRDSIPTCRRLDREHSCRRIDQKRPGRGEGFVGRIDRESPFWQVWRQHTTWSAKYKIFRKSWKINRYKYLGNSDKNNSKSCMLFLLKKIFKGRVATFAGTNSYLRIQIRILISLLIEAYIWSNSGVIHFL